MNRKKVIKPWRINFKAFLSSELLQSLFKMHLIVVLFSNPLKAQNTIQKQLQAEVIETISINGNQIFSIVVSAIQTDYITIRSTLDGEYQNQFQILTKEDSDVLKLSLERIPFTSKVDDKRNAHKVVAATLYIEIPENKRLNIISDVGSVNITGNFKTLAIELLQGNCKVVGNANTASINTIDGAINVSTNSARVDAISSHGILTIAKFTQSDAFWRLRSINGNVTVIKPE